MSEFVKKTLMGYKETPGGSSDPECTHVILAKDEYEKLLRKVAMAEQEVRNIKCEAEKQIWAVQQNAHHEAQRVAGEAQKAVDGAKDALAVETAEKGYQQRLNANLLRITKERANADRKLKPKKAHTGYVVITSEEKEYRYRAGGKWVRVKLWETVLQSPYTVDFTEEQARKQITENLFPEKQEWLISKIGITACYSGTYESMMNDRTVDDSFVQCNVLLARQQRFRMNFRAGYWEFIFMHTRPLEQVPVDMRAC